MNDLTHDMNNKYGSIKFIPWTGLPTKQYTIKITCIYIEARKIVFSLSVNKVSLKISLYILQLFTSDINIATINDRKPKIPDSARICKYEL